MVGNSVGQASTSDHEQRGTRVAHEPRLGEHVHNERQQQEELHVTPGDIRFAGELFFHATDFPRIHVHVYVAGSYTGTPTETDEAIPHWFDIPSIPYDEKWDDDRYWLPSVLGGSRVYGRFTFTGIHVVDYHIQLYPGFDPQ